MKFSGIVAIAVICLVPLVEGRLSSSTAEQTPVPMPMQNNTGIIFRNDTFLEKLVEKIQNWKARSQLCQRIENSFFNKTVSCACTKDPLVGYTDITCTYREPICTGLLAEYCATPKYKISFAQNPFGSKFESTLTVCSSRTTISDTILGNFSIPEICVIVGLCGQLLPVPLISPCNCGAKYNKVTCIACKLCDPFPLIPPIPGIIFIGVSFQCKPGIVSFCLPIPIPVPVPVAFALGESVNTTSDNFIQGQLPEGVPPGFIPQFNLTEYVMATTP